MTKPRLVIVLSAGAVLAVVVAVVVGVSLYSRSEAARESLVVRYFRALSSGDEALVKDLVAPEFSSDLGLGNLVRGSYELFDFGEREPGTLRFLIIVQGEAGGSGAERRAMLCELRYRRYGLTNRIGSIRLVESGVGLKE
ncbi:MAG TPA: hypothetical protein PLW80_03810 [Spirochaetales bacterium]|nr:hypothetical protein [Spirochaetales bacterium]HPB65660.1 hypothetical protein [Spirochaetales bacterium]HPM73444.1 hypothetical protein [Spirochaetales bacterium]HQO65648.1 hypothetical protein [Spirochaetales bacterium]